MAERGGSSLIRQLPEEQMASPDDRVAGEFHLVDRRENLGARVLVWSSAMQEDGFGEVEFLSDLLLALFCQA